MAITIRDEADDACDNAGERVHRYRQQVRWSRSVTCAYVSVRLSAKFDKENTNPTAIRSATILHEQTLDGLTWLMMLGRNRLNAYRGPETEGKNKIMEPAQRKTYNRFYVNEVASASVSSQRRAKR